MVRQALAFLIGVAIWPVYCTVTPAADRGDWLQFRGNSGDGVTQVVDLPTTWSATDNIRWKCELPGEGWSSPVVQGGQIYMTAAVPGDGDQRDLVLLTVDGKSGQLTQQVKVFAQPASSPKIHSKNSHASPTPIIAGDRIYLHFGHQGTACLNSSGQVLWRNDQLSYPPVHGNGGSPALVGSALIFSQDGAEEGKVIALNAATGELLWETKRAAEASRKFSFCTPLVLENAERSLVILPGSNVVQALDAKNGEEVWRVRYEGYSVIPRPIVAAGMVMVCTGYDRPSLMAIRLGGSGDVTDTHVAWQTKTSVPHTPSLITRDDLLFMVSDSGIASCLDAKTGEEQWKERIGGNFSASPLLSGDKIYLLSEEGDTTLVRASRKFEKLGKNSLGDRTLASMAVIDQDLLIRSKSGLWRIGK